MVSRHWVGAIGLLLVLGVVGAITLTPTTVDSGNRADIEQLLAWSHQHGLPTWFVYKQLEFTANIVMFVPIGFFLGLLVSRRWWVTAIAVTVLSIVIESAQLLFLPVRFATLSDVIANSVGGWVGLAIVIVVVNRRIPERRSDAVTSAGLSSHAGSGPKSVTEDPGNVSLLP